MTISLGLREIRTQKMTDSIQIMLALITLIGSLGGSFIIGRANNRTTTLEAKTIPYDVMSEDHAKTLQNNIELRAQIRSLSDELGSVTALANKQTAQLATALANLDRAKKDLSAAREEITIVLSYVHDLRNHIDSNEGPPAPDWPIVLKKSTSTFYGFSNKSDA